MGTGYDAMVAPSHHFHPDVPLPAQRNRFLLLGIMAEAGFHRLDTEWWHYDHPQARQYPLVRDDRVTCLPG